ncbi:MAG: phage distal tail protein [Acidimicrobiales bacterium]
MALVDYSGSFGGLTFGAGTEIQLLEILGLRALPEMRTGDTIRPRDHGDFAGLSLMGKRAVQLKFLVIGSSNADFDTQLAAIGSAFSPLVQPSQISPLTLKVPNQGPRRINCRPTKGATPVVANYQFGYAEILVEVVAPDPRVYDDVQSSITTSLPVPLSGMTFPATFPLTFGVGSGAGGLILALNAGNFETRPLATITGPCTNPRLENRTSGQTVKFAITLGPSDTLTVDFDARSVILNGTASRRSSFTVGSQWWVLAANTTSEIHFGSDDASQTAAQCTFAWRSAWAWL